MHRIVCQHMKKDFLLYKGKRNGYIISSGCYWLRKGFRIADMSERAEIIFMQARLLRLASEEWHMSIQKVNEMFDQYDVLKFIEDCYGVFHMEGDYAVFDEIKTLLKNRGVDMNAGII